MKKLLIVLMLPVVGYFGLKFYLHYKVGKSVDQALTAMQPFADISYKGISSTMSGELSIEGVSAKFASFNDGVTIDKVSIQTPGFWFLMKMGDGNTRSLMSEGFPEKFGLSFDKARYAVNADFNRELDRFGKQLMPERDEDNLAAMCVGRYGFDPIALQRMGYSELVTDMAMSYQLRNGDLEFDFEYNVKDMYDLSLSMTLDGVSSPQVMMGGGYKPMLSDARLEVHDRSLKGRIVEACAEQADLNPEEVIVAGMDAFKELGESNGIVFDDYVLGPYKEFLGEKDSFIVIAAPSEPVDLTRLSLYKASDVPALLNLGAQAL